MLFFAIQASVEGLTYIFGSLDEFDAIFHDKYAANLTLVRTHALSSATALCLGLFAFVRETRRRKVHKTIGRVYGLAVLVGGTTSLPMALMSEGGWTTRLSFFLQGSFWIATMCCAVWAARSKKFRLHRRFMVRNYALTYSAVISRLLLHGLQQSGLSFQEIYPVVSWTWVLGLAVGEWWLWYSAQLPQRGASVRTSKPTE
jgi:uncharacterized membrane protein